MLRYACRLAAAILAAKRAGRIGPLDESRTAHRAWLADCDPNFHMTEGAYLVVAGLARITLWCRMGLGRPFREDRLRPAAVSTAVTFIREILPYAPFQVVSRLIAWDAKYTFYEHRFERGGQLVARVLVRSVFRDRSGVVVPAELLARLGHTAPAAPLPAELARWAEMRDASRGT